MSRRLGLILAVAASMTVSCITVTVEEPTTTVSWTSTATTGHATTSTSHAGSSSTSAAERPYLGPEQLGIESFPVPDGSRPHDVAPAADGGVWYTAQGLGELGWLDPSTGETVHVPLGAGSRPHGVIVDDSGKAWVTDGGLNAIVSFDPTTDVVTTFPLPADRPDVNLNTATFDGGGVLWFTGQNGVYGSFDPVSEEMAVYDAPGGRGPYGITTTPEGSVFYASLAGSHVAMVAPDGTAEVIEPPTPDQGARRVWSDSSGSIWVSEWNSGSLSRYEPDGGQWSTWQLPGESPSAYAVYVDENDIVWVSDFGANAVVRFDPVLEVFDVYPLPHQPGEVRQIHGRRGEVWAGESAADQLILVETR